MIRDAAKPVAWLLTLLAGGSVLVQCASDDGDDCAEALQAQSAGAPGSGGGAGTGGGSAGTGGGTSAGGSTASGGSSGTGGKATLPDPQQGGC
jgi:hypothetical protein